MNKKIIFSIFALSALLLSGCAQKNAQGINNSSASGSTTPTTSTDEVQSTSQPQSNTGQNSDEKGNMISEEEAKEVALAHAGLTANQVTFTKSSIDRDDIRKKYDIEFYTNNKKQYDYEIDGYSGTILEWDVESIYD